VFSNTDNTFIPDDEMWLSLLSANTAAADLSDACLMNVPAAHSAVVMDGERSDGHIFSFSFLILATIHGWGVECRK
jgi:hypothetical protein